MININKKVTDRSIDFFKYEKENLKKNSFFKKNIIKSITSNARYVNKNSC